MNTEDVLSGTQHISRLQAAKAIISKTISADPSHSYGLIIFNAGYDYILPPTFDTGTFLLYLSGITTNLLSDGSKDFTRLRGFLMDTDHVSYFIISDFDTPHRSIRLPSSFSLLGLGSLAGDKVRYPNGVPYYDNGRAVSSVRNDSLAQSFSRPYIALDTLDSFSLHDFLSSGFVLPRSLRIGLYGLVGMLFLFIAFL